MELAREILARTMGLKEKSPLDIQGGLPKEFAPASDVNSLWQEAIKTNPEIKRLDLEIKQPDTDQSPEGLFPGGEPARRGEPATRTPRDQGEWLAGIFIEFPFFEGGLTKAQVEAAYSRYLQSLERNATGLTALK